MATKKMLNSTKRALTSIHPSKTLPQITKSTSNKLANTDDVNEICRVLSDYRNPHHDIESALRIFKPVVSPDLVAQVMKRCKHLTASVYRFYTWARKMSPSSEMAVADTHLILVDVLGSAREFPLVWDFMTELRDMHAGLVTARMFGIVFRAYCKAGLPDGAVKAFRKMEKFGVKGGIEDLNQLLYFMCKMKFVEVAAEFGNECVEKFGFELSAKSYCILMRGWGDIAECAKACNVFDEMVERGVEVDLISVNTLLECLCKGGRTDDAYKLFREIGKAEWLKDLKPDVCSYALFVRASCEADDVQSCMRILDRMRRYGLNPNVYTYSGVIKLYCKNAMLDEAYELLDEMIKRRVKPDVWIYNAMLAYHCDQSEVNMSLRLIRRMRKDGCAADRHTYNMILKMLVRVGRFDRAYEIWNSMERTGFYASVSTFSVMVHGLCAKKGMVEDACRYFEIMIDEGIPPYECTCKLIKESLLRLGHRDKVYILSDKMWRSSSPSIQQLSDIMTGNKVKKESEVVQKHHGHKPRYVGRIKPKKRRNS